MRRSSQDFAVGLTSIVALAGLSTLLLLFGELTFLFESSYRIPLSVNAASGLRKGSQVMFEGVPVGEVERVALEPGTRLPVRLTLRIGSRHRLPAGVEPRLSAGLLGGGTRLDLRVPADMDPTTMAMIDPKSPPDLTARFVSTGEQIDAVLDGLNQAIAKASTGQGTMGRLMNDPKLYNDLSESAQRLSQTLRDLQAMVQRIREEGVELRF
ncbi:MAG: MCE family protein [Planctomycetes bacterium]|nr:MCE family protein [Planctomycetota bacterium]